MRATLLLVLSLVQVPAAQQPGVTADDLAVIDAALGHKARTAMNHARPRAIVLLLDRTLEPCGEEYSIHCFSHSEKTANFLRTRMPEATKERLDALAARNARWHSLTSAPANDVILVAREKLAAAMDQHNANVHAFTSLPAYFDDGTALVFLGYFCGGLCGEGNFILLKRVAGGWKVTKTAM